MESKSGISSPVSGGKTLRVILSPRVVHEFYVRNNILPQSNRMEEINGHKSMSTASNFIKKVAKKTFYDSEIVDSNEKRPIVLLDRLSANDMQKVAALGYLQCINQTNAI